MTATASMGGLFLIANAKRSQYIHGTAFVQAAHSRRRRGKADKVNMPHLQPLGGDGGPLLSYLASPSGPKIGMIPARNVRWLRRVSKILEGQDRRMSQSFRPTPKTDADAVLEANLAFYSAFGRGDYGAMETIWARRATVLCLHPGWTAVEGREAVMESWRRVLGDPDFRIMCHDERVYLYGEMAIVLCEEELSGGLLAASNVFIREDGAWRMIHHQASAIIPTYHTETRAQLH